MVLGLLRGSAAAAALAAAMLMTTDATRADQPCPCANGATATQFAPQAVPQPQASYGCESCACGCPTRIRPGGPNDLFYNYYVPPGRPCGCGVGAEMYPCPRPTPPLVGHTYYTYQPLLPHEYLYHHCRTYATHNPGSGWTATTVKWGGWDAASKLERLFIGPN